MTHYMKQYRLILIFIGLFIFAFSAGEMLPISLQRSLYTSSYVLKEILLQALPFLIFPYVATSLLSLKGRGGFFVILLVSSVSLSSFIAIMLAYAGGFILPGISLKILTPCSEISVLNTLVSLSWPDPIHIEYALFFGFLIGILLNRWPQIWLEKKLFAYRDLSTLFFSKIFTPLLPLYIFGFLIKMVAENDCTALLKNFQEVIFIILVLQISYISLLFLLGTGGRIQRAIESIKNTLPAWLVGFSTISSMITLPVTLEAVEKNVKNKNIGRLTITSTVNCHAAVDGLSIPLLALAILYMTHGALPEISVYLSFAFWLTFAQFSAVSVAGGSVFIALPVLISKLGFTQEMIGLLTGIAILIEPWSTAGNIMANSAFAMLIDRVCGKRN